MPLQLSDDDEEPTRLVTSNTEQQRPGASTSVLDNEQELLELGDVYVPVLPTSSSEIDSRNVYLSEKGGLFDSDSDDELDLLSHHHYNNTSNGKNSVFGIENSRITVGIVVLGLIFLIGFSLLLSYRMIEKPIERQSPKYIELSLLWSPTVCKDSKDEICKTISERVKTDKINFIISSFQPTTVASSCEDPNQSSYLGEKLPEANSKEYKKLIEAYAPRWPPSLSTSGWSAYDKYGRCLYVNDIAVETPSEYFDQAIKLWTYWTNTYYVHLANQTEIPYTAVSFNSFAVPKCKSVEDKQYLLGMDFCILGDNLQPATESTFCEFKTNCDTKKNLLIA
ncbi:predicted protein [Naegleria gruberi]|uniref:Predicted protein n=1 Tax=Naegleria gruberi TaxID=5762 RepID=D2VCV2_NAEGR|nr:uncharacterized protein NAEGRDRAFT_66702 [Naegleria gruberi]EFC45370.1 predicted protein [Naegleria gruberi]|eukprot:XP_002678114.1 predicted protein [Naegleria gruberi strain NEG-M]